MFFWKSPGAWSCAGSESESGAVGGGAAAPWVLRALVLRVLVLVVVLLAFGSALLVGVEPVVALGAIGAAGALAVEITRRLLDPPRSLGQA